MRPDLTLNIDIGGGWTEISLMRESNFTVGLFSPSWARLDQLSGSSIAIHPRPKS
jgi:hypothetical protein